MRRCILALLALLLAWTPAARAGTLLHEVTRGQGTLFVLGSIHMARPDMYPLPQDMEQAFADSDVLVVEVDMDNADQTALMNMVMEHGMYPQGQTLSANVLPETLELLRSLGHEPAMYEAMRPWLVVMTVQVMELMELGYQPEQGVDMHFMAQARQTGKPVEELETAEQQIQMLADMSLANEDRFLFLSLQQMDSLAKIMTRMTDLWMAGDVAGLEELVFTELYDPSFAEYYDVLLYDRNVTMADKLETYLDSGRTAFVVIGAAHLLGPRGVLALLDGRGCDVTQR